jgi:hypothetical protein
MNLIVGEQTNCKESWWFWQAGEEDVRPESWMKRTDEKQTSTYPEPVVAPYSVP